MAKKKKFKETKVGQFLIGKLPAVFKTVAEETLPGKVIEALIGSSELPQEDKTVALAKLEIERAEIDGITRRWQSDAQSQSWLARNIRPLTLLFLTASYIGGWFMGLDTTDTAGLLTWVLCGYFGARTMDKVGAKLK